MTEHGREKGDSREERAALKATTREWHRIVDEESNVITVIKEMAADIRAHNPADAFLDFPIDDLDTAEDKQLKNSSVRCATCVFVVGLPFSVVVFYLFGAFFYCLKEGCVDELDKQPLLALQWIALRALKYIHWEVFLGLCVVIAVVFTLRNYARERATRAALFEELANIGPDDLVRPLNKKRYLVELTQLVMAGHLPMVLGKEATTLYRFVLAVHLAMQPPTKQLKKRRCRSIRDCIPWS
jgi:hypothetical protein